MKKIFAYDFSSDQSTLSTATLNVKISEYNDFPLVIRKSNFQLQGYTKTDRDIVLNPGLYIIEAVKPNGDTESKVVDLEAGVNKELKITFTSKKSFKKEKKIFEEKPMLNISENISFNDFNAEKFEEKDMLAMPVKASYNSPFRASATYNPLKTKTKINLIIRILFFNGKEWKVEKELLENSNLSTEMIDNINYIKVNIDASEYLQILEVRRDKDESIYMVLPLHNNSCTVEIEDNEVEILLSCHLKYSKRATLMLNYLSSNSFEQVSDIVEEEAEDMLYSKMIKPIEAVIGGYALLRIGAIDRMHNWPRNLYEYFPKLSDGAIIAGELEARKGNDKEAIDLFLNAYKRGLPIFREGLSLLVARLRSYMFYDKELLLDAKKQKEIELAYLHLAKLSMFMNDTYELLVINDISLIDDEDFKRKTDV